MKIVNVVTPHMPYENWHIWFFPVGHLLSELLNFVVVAFVVFITVVKLSQVVMKRVAPPAPGEPTTKECPFCLSTIPIKASKCAHCTSDLSGRTDAAATHPA